MIVYIYFDYLLNEMSQVSAGQRPVAHERDFWDYLRQYTFSDAMIHKSQLFSIVGGFASVVYLSLEVDRIRWLKEAVLGEAVQGTLEGGSGQTHRWLDIYLASLILMFISILLLVPWYLDVLHLGFPIVHYLTATVTFGAGQTAIFSYLFLSSVDLSKFAVDSNLFDCWARTLKGQVRPTLWGVLGLHVVAILAGLAKVLTRSEFSSFAFGFCEVAVILGYQLFVYSFEADDRMVTCRPTILAQDKSCADDDCAHHRPSTVVEIAQSLVQ
jgi:hypothetical protein